MEIEKKLSFKELQEHNQAMKHNSDLTNLASALEQLKLEKQELKKQYDAAIAEIEAQEAKINECAEKIEQGTVVPVDEIKELFYGARGKSGKYL